MKRRNFLKGIMGLLGVSVAPSVLSKEVKIHASGDPADNSKWGYLTTEEPYSVSGNIKLVDITQGYTDISPSGAYNLNDCYTGPPNDWMVTERKFNRTYSEVKGNIHFYTEDGVTKLDRANNSTKDVQVWLKDNI